MQPGDATAARFAAPPAIPCGLARVPPARNDPRAVLPMSAPPVPEACNMAAIGPIGNSGRKSGPDAEIRADSRVPVRCSGAPPASSARPSWPAWSFDRRAVGRRLPPGRLRATHGDGACRHQRQQPQRGIRGGGRPRAGHHLRRDGPGGRTHARGAGQFRYLRFGARTASARGATRADRHYRTGRPAGFQHPRATLPTQ